MIYAFATFEVDTAKFELRKSGRTISVEPQVFAVIRLLIENRDRMVSKTELVDAVWDGRAVSESAISSRIRSARNAIEDDGKAQRVIQTVHGRGFRFLASVEELPTSIPEHAAAEPEPGSDPHGEQPAPKNRPSIAVLPFENYSPNSDDSFFAAGLTEGVITNLSRFRDLFVFSRSTTTALSRGGADIGELRRELGTDFVIEGSVQKTETSVRVSFKLVDAATGGNILVERYDREFTLSNIFDIQDKIALLIAGRIANRRDLLGDGASIRADRNRPTKWETYRWLSQFYEYLRLRSPDLREQVKAGLTNALVDEPESSDGWAALAVVLLDEFRFKVGEIGSPEILAEASDHAMRAVSRDGGNAFAHQALAMVQYHEGDYDDFCETAQKSLSLNPGKADALAAFGCCHYLAGRIDQALSYLDEAIELNPVEEGTPRLVRAGCYFMQDRHKEAFREVKKASMTGVLWYHAYLVAIAYSLGDVEFAKAEARNVVALFPGFVDELARQKQALNLADEIEEKFGGVWKDLIAP